MGENINNYPVDFDVQSDDFLLGSDKKTGVTYSYPIQSIIDLIAVASSSVVGIKVVVIQETVSQTFIQIMNADTSDQYTFNTGDVGLIDIYDSVGAWKESYILIKNSNVAITYGLNKSQIAQSDLFPIRIEAEMAIPTSAENVGGGESLVSSNDGDNHKIILKGLIGGDDVNIVQDGDNLSISFDGAIGENNTLENAESVNGNIQLAGAKVGAVLNIKTLKIEGARISTSSTYDTIVVWEKVTKTASFVLTALDNKKTFWMKNVSNVTITVPATLSPDFEAAFYQDGVAQVKFITTGVVAILGGKNAISGQYGTCWLETDPDSVNRVALSGDLISV